LGLPLGKSHDWDALNRLHEKGYIGNPVNKNKSVALTEEGRVKAEELLRILGVAPW
jgi:Mn-dependent DtxR family transcriptional regulator